MVSEHGLADDAPPAEETPDKEVTRRRVRRRVRVRKQEKFPRPVRLALWLGIPVLLWIAIYLVGRALL